MTSLRTLLLFALIGVSRGQSSDCSYVGLLNYLNLSTSNELLQIMRPVKNSSSTTIVQVEMFTYGILGVDAKSQTVTLLVYIHQFWENEFLTWDSSEFCGIDSLSVPGSMLWTPDIAITEDVSDTGTVYVSPLVSLDPSGLVHVRSRQRLTYNCQMDLFRFPFDIQNCNITFSSMSMKEDYIKLIQVKKDKPFTKLPESFTRTQGEWKLLNSAVTVFTDNMSSKTQLVYMVTLQRKPFLYIINLILPLLFLLVLDLASFFVSEDGGEKLGFKVTVLLSIFVLLLILQDILPSTEENMPIIAYYCVSVFTLVWISVLEAMFVAFIANLDGCSEQETQSADGKAEEKLEVNRHHELNGEFQVIPETHDHHVDQPGDAPKPPTKKKPLSYRQKAKIFNLVFFVFYFFAVVIIQIWSFFAWMKDIRAYGLM